MTVLGTAQPKLATHQAIARDLAMLYEHALPLLVQVRGGHGNGAGTIWRPDGVIITNAHVVGLKNTVQITLHDGRLFEGRVLSCDPDRDLALIEIDANDLPIPEIGNSADILPGQFVFAIGHPGGQIDTLTAGIVVAAGRPRDNETARTSDLMRIDARIAPGSSGGPIIGIDGRILGIATRVSGRLSMAIPSATIERFIAEQIPTEARVYLGVHGVIAGTRKDSPSMGFVLTEIIDGAPAARAGLIPGDIVRSIGGEPIIDRASIPAALLRAQPDKPIELDVLRGGLPQCIMIIPRVRESDASSRSY